MGRGRSFRCITIIVSLSGPFVKLSIHDEGRYQQWVEGYFAILCKRNVGDSLLVIPDSKRKGQIWGPFITK